MSRSRRSPRKTNNNAIQRKPPEESKRELFYAEQYHLHQGPLPPPEQLEGYNNVILNGAERLMIMAEKQLDHRISLETKVVDNDIRNSKLGLILGFILQLSAIVGSIIVSIKQSMWEGLLVTVAIIAFGYFQLNFELKKRESELKAHENLQKKEETLKTPLK